MGAGAGPNKGSIRCWSQMHSFAAWVTVTYSDLAVDNVISSCFLEAHETALLSIRKA